MTFTNHKERVKKKTKTVYVLYFCLSFNSLLISYYKVEYGSDILEDGFPKIA